MRAVALGNALGELPPRSRPAADAATRLTTARYAVLVHDGRARRGARARRVPRRRAHRADAGAQRARPARRSVRSGPAATARAPRRRSPGRRAIPWRVSFRGGLPAVRCRPARGLAELRRGRRRTRSWSRARPGHCAGRAGGAGSRSPVIVIGPRASEAPFAVRVAIDTGVAGIHEAGTAYRMDEVPLPLRPPLGWRALGGGHAGRAARRGSRAARGRTG